MSNIFLEVKMSINNNYIEEKFNHIDTKLDGKFLLVEQKLEQILEKYIELDAEHKQLKEETETIRVLVKARSVLILAIVGFISILTTGGMDSIIKLIK